MQPAIEEKRYADEKGSSMLRIIQNSTPAGAKSYYSTADYYTEGQELGGFWRGKSAERLGLTGDVAKDDWDALCDNRNPATGETLTVRQKDNRRVGYDFNFHVPKSVSVLYGLSEDERLLGAFREAVGSTMREMEAEMQARVRRNGQNDDRTTGNMVWGEFVHTTARPVDGVPDPHLHAHCFVFNTTWDDQEQRWKAGQFAGLKRDAPYFEAVFHSKLARGLAEIGLQVRRTRKGWELAGVPESVAEKFSRRTAEIEDMAREKGITDPEAKGELGARTRSGKAKELTLPELQEVWRDRLTGEESAAMATVAGRIGADPIREEPGAARDAAARAVAHVFERKSVVPERTLLAAALKGSYGAASREDVEQEVGRQPLLKAERKGQACVTTPEVLAEERRMIAFARDGRGVCQALAPGRHRFHREWLGDDQRKAVEKILGSHDRVTVLRGGAGTGKTSLMQETVEAVEAGGRKVFTFAPSAEASRGVLRGEGFENADTVARLLLDEKLQQEVRGQVVWVDEAGLLGSRTMVQLFDLAERLEARVILSGDRRQHGSVERGSALKLLEEDAGLVPAEIREIRRQKGDYKMAVAALGDLRTDEGFRMLDKMGWVREVGDDDRYRVLAGDYVETIQAGKSALVVSPTHAEGERITQEIREQLKRLGKVASDEHQLASLASLNLTEAERQDASNYRRGDLLVFHQNAKGHEKGDRVIVGDMPLPLDQAARFQAFRPCDLKLAPGDTVRVTKNGTTIDGKHRLNNGALYEVAGFDAGGNMVLANGWTVGSEFGHLAHGYCVTSHASQGKTVDRVLIGQSSDSFPASSREQFYVSVSRARVAAVIYTDDKEALLAAVERSDDRVTATEFLQRRDRARDAAEPDRSALEREEREPEFTHG